MKKTSLGFFICVLLSLGFTGCYSVFSGGTGGLIVDAESTSNPKAGIANVDIYAYLSAADRDKDYSAWQEGTTFTPTGYYGHTTTGNDGGFTISKLVWKSKKPDFGKDADFTDIYLLFFHENYGLTKGQTLIISDSSSDTVYAELTSIKKTTVLNMNFVDVATGNTTATSLYVKVVVPQTTANNETATAKVYDAIITGSGAISITYPRWQNDEDKAAGKETEPTVSITYVQSSDEVTWQGCYNADNEDKNYAFRTDAATGISKKICNPSYSLTFYGKASRLNVPSIRGQYTVTPPNGTVDDDGLIISLKQKDADGNYSIDLGQVTTYSETIGSSGTEKHGILANLGSGYTWTDTTYTDKFSKILVDIAVAGTSVKTDFELRSDSNNYTVQLQ